MQILKSLKQILKSLELILKSLRPCDGSEGSLRRLGDDMILVQKMRVLRDCDQFFQGRGVPRFSYCCVIRNKVESGAER